MRYISHLLFILTSFYLLIVRGLLLHLNTRTDTLTHTHTHTPQIRAPLDEGLARRREFYLTTPNTHKRQRSMPLAGFKPAIAASERRQTHVIDRAAIGNGGYISAEANYPDLVKQFHTFCVIRTSLLCSEGRKVVFFWFNRVQTVTYNFKICININLP